MTDIYRLFYWPGLPGRGEYVRLAFAAADTEYEEVAAGEGGMDALRALLVDAPGTLPFAPPILEHGGLLLAQTAVILDYLGPRLGLAPTDAAGRATALMHQLTLADFIGEIHDTHHPLGVHLYYEDQRAEALSYAEGFRDVRLPKFAGYFERLLERRPEGEWLLGAELSYPDLSLFQTIEGLVYAFPKTWARAERTLPQLAAHRRRVAALPRIAAYLASERRTAFNQHGIFRHYPELDS